MWNFKILIELIANIIEAIGVISIAIGLLFAFGRFFMHLKKPDAYKHVRQQMGKAILLGLEILVAADIIATVVTEPDMQSVLTLGVIVLIRTFLSFSLEVELEGKFPWQNSKQQKV